MEVQRSWGGEFNVEFAEDWRGLITGWKKKSKVIHLTMYGLPIKKIINVIRKEPSEKLVVVGGAKVPREVYDLANWNVAVTSQPHSEVSALAVFLHEFFEGRELELGFDDAKLRIVPQSHGKRVDVSRVV
jgi:tRNA (cytidine56-2'-O)-methyltransferase